MAQEISYVLPLGSAQLKRNKLPGNVQNAHPFLDTSSKLYLAPNSFVQHGTRVETHQSCTWCTRVKGAHECMRMARGA